MIITLINGNHQWQLIRGAWVNLESHFQLVSAFFVNFEAVYANPLFKKKLDQFMLKGPDQVPGNLIAISCERFTVSARKSN